MVCRKAFGWIAIAAALTVWSDGAAAEADFIEEIQTRLYAGRTAEAAAVAQERLAEVSDDDQARFALGAIQFLQAVEHLGQSLYRYGLATAYQDPTGMAGFPILRIPVPHNPDPENITYDKFRAVLRTFIGDLRAADDTLAGIVADDLDLPLNIGLIKLDLDDDGAASGDEALWHIFERVAGLRWLDENQAAAFLADFDASDVPWLRAYSHLLMAIAEFPLAHDWRDAFETTFHGVFPKATLPSSRLLERDAEALAELEKLGQPPLPPRHRPGEPFQEWQERYQEWLRTDEGKRHQRINKLQQNVWVSSIADLIAFIHLNHWKVVEPQRMRSVLEHLEAMVQFSRESWGRINDETDNRSEWIPSPRQSGVLLRMRVTEERVEGWHQFLNEFEAILEGRKLIPHWRFDQGVNMRRLFLEPTTFDIVLLVQGSAALPYLEDGDLTTEETWDQIMRIFGGDFFRYFIWFN